MTGTMGPRPATTNWTRIEHLNIPSKGALATPAGKPRLVKPATPAAKLPAKGLTLWTHKVAA